MGGGKACARQYGRGGEGSALNGQRTFFNAGAAPAFFLIGVGDNVDRARRVTPIADILNIYTIHSVRGSFDSRVIEG